MVSCTLPRMAAYLAFELPQVHRVAYPTDDVDVVVTGQPQSPQATRAIPSEASV